MNIKKLKTSNIQHISGNTISPLSDKELTSLRGGFALYCLRADDQGEVKKHGAYEIAM